MPICKNFRLPIHAIRRVMCLTGMRLRSFDSSEFAADASLAGAEYIAWTQWKLTYSILASTLPSIQRSLLDLAPFYNNGYHMENEASKNRALPASESFIMEALSSKAPATDHDDERDDCDDSSERMIITKETTYRASVDDATLPMNSPVNRYLDFDKHKKIRPSVQHRDTTRNKLG